MEEENGDRYLVFEANTGSDNYQGEDQVYRWANYGGNDKFNVNNFLSYLVIMMIKLSLLWLMVHWEF